MVLYTIATLLVQSPVLDQQSSCANSLRLAVPADYETCDRLIFCLVPSAVLTLLFGELVWARCGAGAAGREFLLPAARTAIESNYG